MKPPDRDAELAFNCPEFPFFRNCDAAEQPGQQKPKKRYRFHSEPQLGIVGQREELSKSQSADMKHEQAECDEVTDLMGLKFFTYQRTQRLPAAQTRPCRLC